MMWPLVRRFRLRELPVVGTRIVVRRFLVPNKNSNRSATSFGTATTILGIIGMLADGITILKMR